MKPTKLESDVRTMWVTVAIIVYLFLVALVANPPQKPVEAVKAQHPAYCMNAQGPGLHGPCSLLKHDQNV